jgi:hypothetical protein
MHVASAVIFYGEGWLTRDDSREKCDGTYTYLVLVTE